MDCSTPGFPVLHYLPEFAQSDVTELVMPSNYLILCHLLLLLPSIFPSIRVFSNESALHIRWPKYWSVSISPSNDYSGLISFRIDWLDILAVRGTLKRISITLWNFHIVWLLRIPQAPQGRGLICLRSQPPDQCLAHSMPLKQRSPDWFFLVPNGNRLPCSTFRKPIR